MCVPSLFRNSIFYVSFLTNFKFKKIKRAQDVSMAAALRCCKVEMLLMDIIAVGESFLC